MNRQQAIDSLVDVACKELANQTGHMFLTEFVRNGFLGFTKMSNQRLEQELVYWGLKDYISEDVPEYDEDDESIVELTQFRESD